MMNLMNSGRQGPELETVTDAMMIATTVVVMLRGRT